MVRGANRGHSELRELVAQQLMLQIMCTFGKRQAIDFIASDISGVGDANTADQGWRSSGIFSASVGPMTVPRGE